jgi:NTE family protein
VRALVLSGGSVLGSAQVGAVRALLEHHIRPDMLVGTSSGALNAAYLAQEFSLRQVDRLATLWRKVTRADVYPGTHLEVGWRLCSGEDSLYNNENFRRFLLRHGMGTAATFGALGNLPLYVTATHLHSGEMHIFGKDPDDLVLDALMASTAIPPLHAPWTIKGERFVDGGLVTPLPLRVALDYGATEIYAIHLLEDCSVYGRDRDVHGVAAMLVRSISMTMSHLVNYDLLLAKQSPNIELHEIRICIPNTPDVTDFSHGERLYEFGYQTAIDYLQTVTIRHRHAHPLAEPGAAPWPGMDNEAAVDDRTQTHATIARSGHEWPG